MVGLRVQKQNVSLVLGRSTLRVSAIGNTKKQANCFGATTTPDSQREIELETIELSVVEGIAMLTLSRPGRLNAVTRAMRDELEHALDVLRRDPGVRALVLTGAGGNFCSGADLGGASGGVEGAEILASMRTWHRALRAVADFDRPVVAAVDGVAFGMGFPLALAADILIASDRARFCVSFARIGLVPDLGLLYMLPRIVGMQRARELVYSAREFGATEAQDLGIALEVHIPEALLLRAMQIAAALAESSPTAFSMTKRLLSSSFDLGRDAFLDAEANAQAVAFNTTYLKESAARFMRHEPARLQWPVAHKTVAAETP